MWNCVLVIYLCWPKEASGSDLIGCNNDDINNFTGEYL